MRIVVTKSPALRNWLQSQYVIGEALPQMKGEDFVRLDQPGNVIFGTLSPATVSRLKNARYVHIEVPYCPGVKGPLTEERLAIMPPRLTEVKAVSHPYHEE